MSKTIITLPPNPKPAKTLTEFQQAVTVWTRQAEQTVRTIGKVADKASSALITTSIPSGSTVLNGAGVPPNTLGADGNYYIDSVDLDIFLKSAGAWSILAPLGSSIGSLVLNGSGVPSAGLGNNGNYYIDTSANKIYLKSAGSWAIVLTSSVGYPQEVAVASIAVTTGSSGTLNAYTVPTNGLYRISGYLGVHTVGGGDTVTMTFGWTNIENNTNAQGQPLNTSSLNVFLSQSMTFMAKSGTNITYAVNQTGTTAAYFVNLVVERLAP